MDVTIYSTAGLGTVTFWGVDHYEILRQGGLRVLSLRYDREERHISRSISLVPGDVVGEGEGMSSVEMEEKCVELWGEMEIGPH